MIKDFFSNFDDKYNRLLNYLANIHKKSVNNAFKACNVFFKCITWVILISFIDFLYKRTSYTPLRVVEIAGILLLLYYFSIITDMITWTIIRNLRLKQTYLVCIAVVMFTLLEYYFIYEYIYNPLMKIIGLVGTVMAELL